MSTAKVIRFGGAKPTDPTYPPSMPTVGAVDAPVTKATPAAATPARQFFKTAKGPAKPVTPTISVSGGLSAAVRRLIAR